MPIPLIEPRLGLNGLTSAAASSAAPAPPTPLANAGPLGLSAFAITTFLLSMVNAGLIAKGAEPVVFGMALMVGGLAQVLAGMWEFRTGNTFAGTAFVAYGAFWLSFWALVQFYIADIPKADVGDALGLYLIAWGIFTAYMFVASFKTSRGVNVVLRPAAVHLPRARNRRTRGEHRPDEGRRLPRPADRGGRSLRRHGGDHQCDVRSHRPSDPPADLRETS